MELSELFELLRMLDSELYILIDKYGIYIYLVLFLIVFGKTGFVILTFLPGDSLVFASGTLAAIDQLNIYLLFILFFIATTLADSNNFLIGRLVKRFLPEKNLIKLIPQSAINHATEFLFEYDKVAMTFSRFIPLMRTMTPFTAGFTNHPYRNFIRYNLIGAFIWTTVWLCTGFTLGNFSWVENNLLFTLSMITIVMFIPTIYGFISHFKKKNRTITKDI